MAEYDRAQFSKEEVLPHLVKSLQSDHRGVRYWTAQIASSSPDKQLIEPLYSMVNEKEADIRWAAYIALEAIRDKSVLLILKNALRNEKEPDNYEKLEDIIENYE